jgi:hypothetical protein
VIARFCSLGNALFSAYAAEDETGYRICAGMIEAVLNRLREHGAIALLLGGAAIYLVLLVLDLSIGWRLAYPYSIAWVGVVALPAAGVALLYLQTSEDGADDRDGEGEMK